MIVYRVTLNRHTLNPMWGSIPHTIDWEDILELPTEEAWLTV